MGRVAGRGEKEREEAGLGTDGSRLTGPGREMSEERKSWTGWVWEPSWVAGWTSVGLRLNRAHTG